MKAKSVTVSVNECAPAGEDIIPGKISKTGESPSLVAGK